MVNTAAIYVCAVCILHFLKPEVVTTITSTFLDDQCVNNYLTPTECFQTAPESLLSSLGFQSGFVFFVDWGLLFSWIQYGAKLGKSRAYIITTK